MKNNKIYFRVLIACMILIIIYAMSGLVGQKQKEKTYKCSVVLDNSSSDRWVSYKRGLEQAAKEYHVKLNIVSSAKLRGTAEEVRLMSKEIKNGADGLIVQICEDKGFWSVAEEIIKKAYIVLTETDILPEKTVSSVTPDWSEIGKSLAKAVIKKELAGRKTKLKIGIISENESLLSTQQIMNSFTESLLGKNAEVSWILYDCNADKIQKQLQEEPSDILVSLENDHTETTVDVLSETGYWQPLYAIGCSEKLVYYLDHGQIQTLVIPNDFLMGYLSVENLVKQLENHRSIPEHETIEYYVVDQDNLYDEKIQRILFPIVQ